MQISEQWLREWANPALSAQQMAHQLTMAGLEVDALQAIAPPFNHVVVGEIIAIEQHPQADRLRVTTVNVGLMSRCPLFAVRLMRVWVLKFL
jgi:phenylalanyl-tRNA synthetase beta chain